MFKYPKYKFYYAMTDFIILILSFLISGSLIEIIYSKSEVHFNYFSIHTFIYYIIASFVFIFIFQYYNLYKMNVFLTRAVHLVQILKSLMTGVSLLIIFTFLFKLPFIPEFRRLFVLFFYVVVLIAFIIIRILLLQVLNSKYFSKTILNRNIIIVGAEESGIFFAEKILFENLFGITLLGFIDDKIEKGTIVFSHLKCLGKINDLNNIISENKIDEIIISMDKIDYDSLMKLIDSCTKLNINVKLSSSLFKIVPDKIFIEEYSDVPVIDVTNKLNSLTTLYLKKLFDIIIAFSLLLLFSPVFIIIFILIKLTSRGPALFSQTRIGKNGKPFKFYKFRSMTLKGEEDTLRKDMMLKFMKNDETQFDDSAKIINENRITRIGKILRKTSLDEIPQLLNVIKGDMSLVGPRPCLPYEYENYDEWQKRRLTVLPGCTGIWQVSARSDVSFKDSVILDLFYINNMTPWLDLQLLFKTIPVMLFAKGGK